ncbi:MAG: ROK family protein [Fimbriimonadaceae bacterium]
MRRCVVGVDVGGTNVRACAFHDDGNPAGPFVSRPSHAQEGTERTIEAISGAILEAIGSAECTPEGVGVAVPGHIDNAAGLVRWAPNFGEEKDGVFHYWRDVPLRQALSKSINLPILLDNDANAAALGEYKFGAGRNSAKCLVMLTVGTGIGGGVILSSDALLFAGTNHTAATGPIVLVGGNKGGAELGHIILQHGGVEANAGSYGALEAYCQRDAIVRRAAHRLQRGRNSILNDLVKGDLGLVSPKLLSEAADQGDELAIEVWRETGEYLGVGIGSLINVFAPDVFAIGGQIAKAGEWLLGPARITARNVAIPSLFEDCSIVQAEQIEDAGVLGGAALALEWLQWNKTN